MQAVRTFVYSTLSTILGFINAPVRTLLQFSRITNPVGVRLTREGLQFAFMISFALFGAVLRDVNLLIILAGALVAMMFLQWRVCTRTLRGLSVDRRLPRSMHARRAFEVELILRNPKTWLGSWLVLVQDRMVYSPASSTIHRAAQNINLLFMSVPPQSSRNQRYRCVANRRGRYRFLGIELTTRFPLGLMRGVMATKESNTFIVQPALGRLLPVWNELFQVRETGARHRRVRSLSDEGEFFGLRAYRHGDSPRWIHWRSSARRDELVVKQFQQPESRELFILLDLAIPPESERDARSRYLKAEDLAVEFVATLVHQMTNANIGSVTIAIADQEPTVALRVQARSQTQHLLDRLGVARGSSNDSLVEALQLLERDCRFVPHLIVISTRARPDRVIGHRSESEIVPFWRSIDWLNADNGDIARYFVPAE